MRKLAIIISGTLTGLIGALMKMIGDKIPVLSLVFLRFFLGTLFLLILMSFIDRKFYAVSKSDLKSYALVGLTMATALLTAETAGESITIYQIPKEDSSPSETSHVNLNRMLSLACVDYVKAMTADLKGDIEKKEYYMREFWKKVGDNDSNKRKTAMLFPSGSYAVR